MRISSDPRIYEIHTSTYLFLCYFPNIAPKSSKKLFLQMLTIRCHDVTSRDRLDAIFLQTPQRATRPGTRTGRAARSGDGRGGGGA